MNYVMGVDVSSQKACKNQSMSFSTRRWKALAHHSVSGECRIVHDYNIYIFSHDCGTATVTKMAHAT